MRFAESAAAEIDSLVHMRQIEDRRNDAREALRPTFRGLARRNQILPHFDQIFSPDGKTTYQMKDIHEGHYVGIIYDQKALGVRHADKIYVMNNANERIGQP